MGSSRAQSQPPLAAAEAAAAPPSKRPRTVGGFVDESEDEEEEPAAQPQEASATRQSATEAQQAPQPSFTNTPNNTLPNPDVQLHSAQDQAPASVSAPVAVNEPAPSVASVPNGSTPVPDATKPATPDVLNVASARPSVVPATPAPTSAALPKARLPQDRVGILEDRIAEDPRGDIEAWLSLIEEHRRRHKHDDARAVFERFLKVFPSAVSTAANGATDPTNTSRANNGSNTSCLRPNSTSCQKSSTSLAVLFPRLNILASILLTSTSFDVASTSPLTKTDRIARQSPKPMSSSSTLLVSMSRPVSCGLTISRCSRPDPACSAAVTGKTCKRWILCVKCTSVQLPFLTTLHSRSGAITTSSR